MNSNFLSEEKINEIRTSVDIVEIISSYLPLIAKGKNFFGVCPFHSDHSPSMSVSKEKQIYTCFSCGATGNVYNFIMDYENVSFIEAVKIVANKAGFILNINDDLKTDKNKKLYDIYNISQKFYMNNINTANGIDAKKYLEKRNINNDCIKEFGIGLAIDSRDSLLKLLLNKNYDAKDIEKAGLVIKNNYGYSDMYSDRIMFPLFDLTGKIVGYSGRVYNKDIKPKYYNTKETEIFKKGETLYNYHKAKESVRENNKLIVVEGFMDVIRMYTIGITNVVAAMGTAVTKNQALLMKRLSNEIILCFDGDEAGNEATNSCINELLKIGISPKIVRLEQNLDPDEYILKYGKEKFVNKIENPMNSMEYKMNYLKKEKDLQNNFEMAQYVESVINELSNIDNDIYRELTLQKLSDESKLNIDYLRSKINKNEKIKIDNKEKTIKKNKYEIIEQNLIYQMLCSKEAIKIFAKNRPLIENEINKKIINKIGLYYKEKGNIILADIITYFDSELRKVVNSIINSNVDKDYDEKELMSYINSLNKRKLKKEIDFKNELIKKEIDPIKKAQILNEIIELKKTEEIK